MKCLTYCVMRYTFFSNFSGVVIIILLKHSLLLGQNSINAIINTPKDFERVAVGDASFGEYLRNLPLKPKGSKVKYYNGGIKNAEGIYTAVVDLSIGNKDLHQCADAIMRLRAEYLFLQKRYNEIQFNFTNGFRVDYSNWKQGYRIKTTGNKTSWVKKESSSNSYNIFWEYLEQIFMYAGTASLSKELLPIKMSNLEIGDVFIKGGFPGHAVIVVDKAMNKNGKTAFLLAQSYMPAQEIQILINPMNNNLSPWYMLDENEKVITPEWTFTTDQLARFKP